MVIALTRSHDTAETLQQCATLSDLSTTSRDPHVIPLFDSTNIAKPKATVLYLPPLLSSLPEGFTFPPIGPKDAQVVVTETRLPDIDPPSLSLHKALHEFKPLSSEYASTLYTEAFNWSELLLPKEDEREWYCVVFRSKREAGSDAGSLYEADRHAHEEAIRNGGLIMYWYGVPHETTGANLATCIWQSRKYAVAAISRPSHVTAMRLAAESYEVYSLERHILRKVKGQSGITIEPYVGGEVGW